MESTPRCPTTGTGLTTQSNRTEEESFATRGNFAVVKKTALSIHSGVLGGVHQKKNTCDSLFGSPCSDTQLGRVPF